MSTNTTNNKTDSKELMKNDGVISISPENGFITLTIDNYQKLLDSNKELLKAAEVGAFYCSQYEMTGGSLDKTEFEQILTAINNAKNINK